MDRGERYLDQGFCSNDSTALRCSRLACVHLCPTTNRSVPSTPRRLFGQVNTPSSADAFVISVAFVPQKEPSNERDTTEVPEASRIITTHASLPSVAIVGCALPSPLLRDVLTLSPL